MRSTWSSSWQSQCCTSKCIYAAFLTSCAAGDVSEFVNPGSWVRRCALVGGISGFFTALSIAVSPYTPPGISDVIRLGANIALIPMLRDRAALARRLEIDDDMSCIAFFCCTPCHLSQQLHEIELAQARLLQQQQQGSAAVGNTIVMMPLPHQEGMGRLAPTLELPLVATTIVNRTSAPFSPTASLSGSDQASARSLADPPLLEQGGSEDPRDAPAGAEGPGSAAAPHKEESASLLRSCG